jgi:peptidoglycan/xylan/chitin deacetylase (PgdA/CDA1 family)
MLPLVLILLLLALPTHGAAAWDGPMAKFMTGPHPLLSYTRTGEAKLYRVSLNGSSGHLLWGGDLHSKRIALTFDDGPNPMVTPQVLKILEEKRVRATFFLIGQNAQRHPDLVRQIHDSGHALGNHTFSHVKLPRTSTDALRTELERTREIIKDLTDTDTRLFRPPFGAVDARTLTELVLRNFDVVLWSVDSRDWTGPGVNAIKNNVLSRVRGGAVILCHDGHGTIAQALPAIVEKLQEDGYQFVTVPEMIRATEEEPPGDTVVRPFIDLPWTPAMWRLP